jgi:hypothetical protein
MTRRSHSSHSNRWHRAIAAATAMATHAPSNEIGPLQALQRFA